MEFKDLICLNVAFVILAHQAASVQYIQIQALPQTINYRENDLVILCSITVPSQFSSVFFINLQKNSSTTFETLVSVANGQTSRVQWKDTTLQNRASATGNVDSPSSAQLRLTIDRVNVQCPADFKSYICKMSGITDSAVVTQETSPISISVIVKPTVIEMPRVKILNENHYTQSRQFPVDAAIQLICQGEVGMDASKTIRWCVQKADDNIYTRLSQTPIHSEASLSGCQYTRSSTITYNLTKEDTFTKFLCESGYTGLCGTGTAMQFVNIAIEGSPNNNTRTTDMQPSFLVPFLSGSAVGVCVIIFGIILAIILRRHFRQEQMKRNVYQEHNDGDSIPNCREEHCTEADSTEDHIYTECSANQAERQRDTAQYGSISDHQYIGLNTINQQGKKKQACPTANHPYSNPLNTIQMIQSINSEKHNGIL